MGELSANDVQRPMSALLLPHQTPLAYLQALPLLYPLLRANTTADTPLQPGSISTVLCIMHALFCRCRMRTKQKGKMTFTGTSNASSSGLQRTGSEISDSESFDSHNLANIIFIMHIAAGLSMQHAQAVQSQLHEALNHGLPPQYLIVRMCHKITILTSLPLNACKHC